MLKLALTVLILVQAVAGACQNSPPNGSLMPPGIRAIATPDDSAIIVVSDPTNGTGQGLQWLGIGGAIACSADNSIVVWSAGGAGRTPPPAAGLPVAPPPQVGQPFLWPEGAGNARPFDLDRSITKGTPRPPRVPMSPSERLDGTR